jgi:hypothetical protein
MRATREAASFRAERFDPAPVAESERARMPVAARLRRGEFR